MEKVAQEEPREETADEAETEKRVVWLQALLARFGQSNGSGSAAAWQIAGTSFTAPRLSTLAGIVVVVILNSMVVSSLLPAASAEQQPSYTSSLSEQPSVRSPLWSPPSPWPPPPPVSPCMFLAPPQAPPPSTPSPPPSPSPTPPSTPPSPPPRMLTHDEQCAVLNDRFEHAHPSNSLLEAGVLVRQFVAILEHIIVPLRQRAETVLVPGDLMFHDPRLHRLMLTFTGNAARQRKA